MLALLVVLDLLITVLHAGLIVFNLFGWIWKKTRRLHLYVLGITIAGWLVLGLVYGIGYCVCTDWQWRLRAAMDRPETADSFVQYLVRAATGWEPGAELTRNVSAASAGSALVISLVLNLRDRLSAGPAP